MKQPRYTIRLIHGGQLDENIAALQKVIQLLT